MLRVGRIPYLNCEPFFHRLAGVELVDLIPRRLGEAMAAGELDAGPLSLMDYVRLESRLVPLPYGIGCPTGARSVLVFADRPLADLAGARIAVTLETSTSVELLRTLLALRYDVEPAAWVGPDEPCEAQLLIGDQAIWRVTGGPPARHVIDLAVEWRDWTGLPFVFARWAVAARVPARERRRFESALDEALDRGLDALPEIASARRDLGWSGAQVESYLRNFAFRLGPDEEKGAAEFIRLRGQIGAA
ncbi:MAG TPA: menaquinone biosynthesis protein [Methylomirabilota bacterium]|nr:menaquinone biosynthesis protein [Methylomirabilota bacterium]